MNNRPSSSSWIPEFNKSRASIPPKNKYYSVESTRTFSEWANILRSSHYSPSQRASSGLQTLEKSDPNQWHHHASF